MDAGVGPGDTRGLVGLLNNGVWLLGLAAQGLGVALQAAALDRGRVAIIQPLLVTSIVWALPLGHLLTNQTITRRHVAGATIIVVGLAVFATVGDPAAGADNAPTSDWISAMLVIAASCIAFIILGGRGGLGTKAAVFGATAGTLYGLSATLMKPVVETWHADGLGELLDGWQLWVMAGAGLAGFYFSRFRSQPEGWSRPWPPSRSSTLSSASCSARSYSRNASTRPPSGTPSRRSALSRRRCLARS